MKSRTIFFLGSLVGGAQTAMFIRVSEILGKGIVGYSVAVLASYMLWIAATRAMKILDEDFC